MQRTMFVNQAAAFPKAAATPARIAPAAATCQLKQQDSMLTLKQGLAVAGALLSLTMGVPNAEAKLVAPKVRKFEKSLQYQESLRASVRSRTGSDTVLPELKAAPAPLTNVVPKPAVEFRFKDSKVSTVQRAELGAAESKQRTDTLSLPTPGSYKPAAVAAPAPRVPGAIAAAAAASNAAPAAAAAAPAPAAAGAGDLGIGDLGL